MREPTEEYEYIIVRVATFGNKSRYTNVSNAGAVRKVIHEFSIDSGIVIADIPTDANNFEFVRPGERVAIQELFNTIMARVRLKQKRSAKIRTK